jgi:hypothetical protein
MMFPAAGTTVAAAVLGMALVFPGFLGPTYRGFKDDKPVNPAAIRRIPLPGTSPSTEAGDPEWADAGRTALQQGQVTVQVDEVTVASVPITSSETKKGKADASLVIRLRIQTMPGPRGGAASGDLAALKDTHRPALTDAAGKAYALLDVQAGGTPDKGRRVLQFGLASRVLVFEAPPADVQFLRLELPAAAWGGSGTYRFAIPGSLIQRK